MKALGNEKKRQNWKSREIQEGFMSSESNSFQKKCEITHFQIGRYLYFIILNGKNKNAFSGAEVNHRPGPKDDN